MHITKLTNLSTREINGALVSKPFSYHSVIYADGVGYN